MKQNSKIIFIVFMVATIMNYSEGSFVHDIIQEYCNGVRSGHTLVHGCNGKFNKKIQLVPVICLLVNLKPRSDFCPTPTTTTTTPTTETTTSTSTTTTTTSSTTTTVATDPPITIIPCDNTGCNLDFNPKNFIMIASKNQSQATRVCLTPLCGSMRVNLEADCNCVAERLVQGPSGNNPLPMDRNACTCVATCRKYNMREMACAVSLTLFSFEDNRPYANPYALPRLSSYNVKCDCEDEGSPTKPSFSCTCTKKM